MIGVLSILAICGAVAKSHFEYIQPHGVFTDLLGLVDPVVPEHLAVQGVQNVREVHLVLVVQVCRIQFVSSACHEISSCTVHVVLIL